MGNVFLEIFLLLNVLAIGVLGTLGLQSWRAHQRSKKPGGAIGTVQLSPAVKAKLLQAAQLKFQLMLNRSADELQKDLGATSNELNRKLGKLGEDIINNEMRRYRDTIDKLQNQAEKIIDETTLVMNGHQDELKAKLEDRHTKLEAKLQEELSVEKASVIALIDDRLADSVASFLTETMQHEIDLGAQGDYLIQKLEEHKEILKQEIRDVR